ncbi:MAG: hypothetical protein M3179_03825 [Actinomycetota bacterium]|nr:hypothetical protein [Actinomycetota bacterium]
MCFSAEADLATGLVAGLAGVDALRHTRQPGERVLAALPVLFGAHQLTEAFVWWGLTDRVPWTVGDAAVWLYLSFAFVLLPVFVPLAVLAVEPDAGRRTVMKACAALGAVVAVVYLVALLVEPVSAQIDGHRVVYLNRLDGNGAVNALYVVSGCLPLLSSSHRGVVAFGVVNVAALAVLLWLDSNAKTSLWCAWAALSSVAIAAHLRHARGPSERRSTLRRQWA